MPGLARVEQRHPDRGARDEQPGPGEHAAGSAVPAQVPATEPRHELERADEQEGGRAPTMCTIRGAGKSAKRWSAGMIAGPPASWISRSTARGDRDEARAAPSGTITVRRAGRPGREPRPSRTLHGGHQTETRSAALIDVTGATSWPGLRHSETPSPIRARPVGTAIGRLNASGRHGERDGRDAWRRRAGPRPSATGHAARNSAMPKSSASEHVADAGEVEHGLHPADVADRRAAGGCDDDVVDVAGVARRSATGSTAAATTSVPNIEQVAEAEHAGSRSARARRPAAPDAGTCR